MKIIKTPKSVDIDITNRCNLRCKHCYYYTSEAETQNELSTDEWLRFFEELNRCAVMSIKFGGGEPFIREDFREIINGVVNNRMRFEVLSNGTLIDDAWARFLASTGRCNYIQVSIDGSGADIHDRLRGKGSFSRAVEGIEHLRKHNISVAVRVIINRHNLDDLDATAKFLLEDLGLGGFSTNAASHMGLCRSYHDDVQLSVEDRTKAMRKMVALQEKYPGCISANAGPLAEAKHFTEMEQARKDGLESMPNGGFLTSCGCIFNSLAIRSDGVIVPCNLLSHLEMGRVNQDSLEEIWHNHPILQSMRSRREVPLGSFDYCKGCAYIQYCRGSCPALAYTAFGTIDHPSPDGCLKRFLEEGGSLPHKEMAALNETE